MKNLEDSYSKEVENVNFDLIDTKLIDALSKGKVFELSGIGTFQIKSYSDRRTISFKQSEDNSIDSFIEDEISIEEEEEITDLIQEEIEEIEEITEIENDAEEVEDIEESEEAENNEDDVEEAEIEEVEDKIIEEKTTKQEDEMLILLRKMKQMLREGGEVVLGTGIFRSSVREDKKTLKISFMPSIPLREMLKTGVFQAVKDVVPTARIGQKSMSEQGSSYISSLSEGRRSSSYTTTAFSEKQEDKKKDTATGSISSSNDRSDSHSTSYEWSSERTPSQSDTNTPNRSLRTKSKIGRKTQKGGLLPIKWFIAASFVFGVIVFCALFWNQDPTSGKTIISAPIGDGIAVLGVFLAAYIFFKRNKTVSK